jgi:hypothetical protein
VSYDTQFYLDETRVALESAQIVLPRIIEETGAMSIIDVGCGTGGWAVVAQGLGADVKGVDWGVPSHLRLVKAYVDHDLSNGYDCTGWDLAVCLEVAEHLPAEAAEPLVAGLAAAKAILFSAATPGQPGVGHIHCRPHAYWHGLFRAEGFEWTHVGGWFDEPVADFYRRNMFLYREVS